MTAGDLSRGIVPSSTRTMNLAHFLAQAARRRPDGIGLVWGEDTWTWAHLHDRVRAMAAALASEFGVAKGDRVLVHSPNCNQMFESMFACFQAGAVWVPTNYRQTPEEIAYIARSSGARVMICGAAFAQHAEACKSAVPALASMIAIGFASFAESYDAIVERHRGAAGEPAPVDRDDPCWFFCTSGTTGRPKAAVLTHGQMGFVVTNHLCDLMPSTGQTDSSLVVAPLSHGAGIHQLAQVARGATTVIPGTAKLDPEVAWQMVERWRVTNMFTVPTILNMLVSHVAVDRYDHSTLRHVIYAGAPMYRADQRHALEKLGPVLVQYYGLGEVTGNITVLPPAMHSTDDERMKIGCCGFERTGMQISIRDDEGAELGVDEIGEVCVIGPAVFAGYFDDEAANRKAFRNGWFRTGDLGRIDAEGFLFLTGRNSDMYISGGSNIYPMEIEDKLLDHPDIAEAAILGMPDRQWGEVGVAVCVPRPGASLDAESLIAWLSGRIAAYKMPRRFVIRDALEKSAYGKVAKKQLREELLSAGTLD